MGMASKGNNKSQIVKYIFDNKAASKAEIAKELGLSMPTVLQNTKELVGQGIVAEAGEYESTGGRKAKSLALRGDAAYAVGLDITANHISLVLIDLTGDCKRQLRMRKPFRNSLDYDRELAVEVEHFLAEAPGAEGKVLGIGISLPGIVDQDARVLLKSHALRLENISLKTMEQIMPYPAYFENDANAAMNAEQNHLKGDAVYLSLSNTVGGAISIGGSIYRGAGYKAGEFGHMVMVPGGRPCYCGKKGCVDAYCSPLVLTRATGYPLEMFMERVERGEEDVKGIWDEYLGFLAIAVTNLRMAYDTNVMLGGYLGGYLDRHMFELGKKAMGYNLFDGDVSYLKNCVYKKEGSAIGAALHFIYEYIGRLR